MLTIIVIALLVVVFAVGHQVGKGTGQRQERVYQNLKRATRT